MENLAKKFYEFRKKNGWTQNEISKMIGVPQKTWSTYETGRSQPPVSVLIELEKIGFDYKSAFDLARDEAGLSEEEAKRKIAMAKNFSQTMPVAEVGKMLSQMDNYTIFKYNKPVPISVPVEDEHDPTRLVLLPFYNQKASAGPGEEPTQLQEVNSFIPVLQEVLRGANPASCGITQVKGDSMTDVGLFSGDFVIFNTAQTDGDGIYVITINGVTRIKRLENRPIEKKIIISSENAKRYPTPEILSYDQATEALTIHGKVIAWIHRHFY